MDINKICPGCMKEIENRDNVGVCPYCGYDIAHAHADSHQLAPFTILAGKYLVGRVIGEGGFGISYIGCDMNLDLVVAIKEYYPNGYVTRDSNITTQVTIYQGKDETDIVRWRDGFINEAKNMAKFSDLNGIVEVRDFIYENNTAYIVMEYIDGVTLKQYLNDNGGKINPNIVFTMMKPVVMSLAKVHDAGMIHRDISPDNIMITKKGRMKLLDFGAAREYDEDDEKSFSIMLKRGYAPEEQYRSHGKQGPWSDVYALTATIYKCITGITPVESMERMRNDTLKMPEELGIKLTTQQSMAIKNGMAVYAEDRIQSMDELYNLLYMSKPVKKVYKSNKTKKKINKRVKLIVIGALCVVFLLTVIIGLLFGNFENDKTYVSTENDNITMNEDESEGEFSFVSDLKGQYFSSLINEYQSMLENKNYEELINEIINSDLSKLDEDEYNSVHEILRQAIEGHKNTFKSNLSLYFENDDLGSPYSSFYDEQEFLSRISDESSMANEILQNSPFDMTYDDVTQSLLEYLYSKAEEYADVGNEGALNSLFDRSDSFLVGEAYEEIKYKMYAKVTIKVIYSRKETYSVASMIDYINTNFEKTGYDCWVNEFWYYFEFIQRSERGETTEDTDVYHKKSSGYLLENSDKEMLVIGDISHLTKHELYLALYEIYARHGRMFSDSTVQNYFDNCSWYTPTIIQDDFDESILNEYERANRNLIVEYEMNMGYR